MPKLVLDDITNILGNPLTAQVRINNNSRAIEAAVENTLSRDGTTPNQMNADIDLNHNDLLNVKMIDADDVLVGGESIDGLVQDAKQSRDEAEGFAQDALSYAESIEKAVVFDTIGDFLSAEIPTATNVVSIRGYYTAGDKGAHKKKRVATPSVPGIQHSQSGDGSWWEYADSTFKLPAFGADPTGGATAHLIIKQVLEYASSFSGDGSTRLPRDYQIVDGMSGRYLLNTPITPVGVRHVQFRNATLVASDTSANWTNNNAMINIAAGNNNFNIDLYNLRIDGSFWKANGIVVEGAHHVSIRECFIQRFRLFGVNVGVGQCRISQCVMQQFLTTDPEWSNEANHTGSCIIINAGDAKVHDNILSWCKIPLVVDGPWAIIEGNHIFNGPGETGTFSGWRTNIQLNHVGANVSGNYIDNGSIDVVMTSANVNNGITSNIFLHRNDKITGNTSLIRFIATAANQDIDSITIEGNTAPRAAVYDWISYDETNGSFVKKLSLPQNNDTGETAVLDLAGGRHMCARTKANESVVAEFYSAADATAEITFRALTSTTPYPKLGVQNDNLVFRLRNENRLGIIAATGSPRVYSNSDLSGAQRLEFGTADTFIQRGANGEWTWNNGTYQILFTNPGHLRPSSTATQNLGTTGTRWNNIYLSNSPDVSSDRRLKEDISEISPAEISAAKVIAGLVRRFRVVGSDQRWRYGVVAQEVEDALVDAGIDPRSVGFLNFNDGPDENGMMSIIYAELQMLLLAGLQSEKSLNSGESVQEDL